MDKKSEEIYKKIEDMLEERKGSDRRDKEEPVDEATEKRRSKQDRRQNKED